MEIKNLEEVFHLLKMKSNTENLLAYQRQHDCYFCQVKGFTK